MQVGIGCLDGRELRSERMAAHLLNGGPQGSRGAPGGAGGR